MMRTYLQDLYDAVPFSIDEVRNREDWRHWRAGTLTALRTALGLERFPRKTPLKPRMVGVIDRGDFLMEKVVFESRPDFLMTASLYRPKKVAGRVPAVLCVHGHTMKGKTSDSVQARAVNYARAGWVALAVDATGHGERVHIGHRRTFAIVTTGLTLEGIQVWDNIRAVDYLLTRPEVDPGRIGISGCSGGGNQTMYTAAIDERIAVAVPVCSVSTLRGQIFTNNGIGCQCECVPDLMRHGLENAVVCALIAPRPLLVLSGTKDAVFPVTYTREANRHLARFYEAIGYPDRYAFIERRLPHGYQRPFRQVAHAWFDRWLNRRPRMVPYHEKGPGPLPAEAVWCFPDGRLPADSATIGSLAHDLGRKQVARLTVPATPAARSRLRRRIRDEVLGGFPEPGASIGATIALPADVAEPVPCVVLVREKPATRRWTHAGAFIKQGCAVAELDPRPLGADEHVSRAALVLGRPLVGMAAHDITRFVDDLETREDIDARRVSLWAEDLMALPALYALALDRRIAGATLVGLLSTYVSPTPVQHPTWTFARGLLKYADIEHLAALAAPRPLVIANPVGPDLKPISAGRLRRAFTAARGAYAGTRHLRLLAGDATTILKRALSLTRR